MSVSSEVQIEQLTINTIRTLSMDAVQAAKSGHPGTPMALAPVAHIRCGAMSCGSIPMLRIGRPGIDSSSRAAMRRCYSTRCSIWRA